MTIRLSIASLLALLANNACAECPVRVDDTHGIVLTRTQQFLSSLFKVTPEGLSEYRLTDKVGTFEKVSVTYIHALAPQERISNKNTVRVEYAEPVEGLAELDRKKVWSSAATVLIDGVAVMKGTATKSVSRHRASRRRSLQLQYLGGRG